MKLDPTGMPLPTASRVESAMSRLEQTARSAQEGQSPEDLKKIAEEFEALMLAKLVESMRKTVPKSELFPESSSQALYDGMMDDALGHHLAKAGGFGIQDQLLRQWSRGRNEAPSGPEELAAYAGRLGMSARGAQGPHRSNELDAIVRGQGAQERNDPEPLEPGELSRILQESNRDLGGLDDGETPLSELPPPTRDEWLFSPQAEQVLRALMGNDPASPSSDDEP